MSSPFFFLRIKNISYIEREMYYIMRKFISIIFIIVAITGLGMQCDTRYRTMGITLQNMSDQMATTLAESVEMNNLYAFFSFIYFFACKTCYIMKGA